MNYGWHIAKLHIRVMK